jgi:hypothetical protein
MLTWDDVPSLPIKITVDPVTKKRTIRVAIPMDFAEIRAALRPASAASDGLRSKTNDPQPK